MKKIVIKKNGSEYKESIEDMTQSEIDSRLSNKKPNFGSIIKSSEFMEAFLERELGDTTKMDNLIVRYQDWKAS